VRRAVHLLGHLPDRELAAVLASVHAVVLPSRYEPFGMVVLEGMLYGLPIVASAVGGPAEILDQDRTGLLVPVHDVGALADAIIRLVREPALRQQIGQAAAAEVRANWLWPCRVPPMRRVYEEIVGPTGLPDERASEGRWRLTAARAS
jgi:glycogen(starch) synthase